MEAETGGKKPSSLACLRWNRRLLIGAILLAPCVVVLLKAYQIGMGRNLHPVIPGQVYRSAQPTRDSLQDAVERLGVRTVINLRGCCVDRDWYLTERQTAKDLGVAHYDVNFSSYIFPGVPELHKLLHALDTCEYPVLLHCRRGADRSGLASAIVVLLQDEGSLADARAQMSCRYGHFWFGRSWQLNRFLDMYEQWLREEGLEHSPGRFRHWACEHYQPGKCWAEIERLAVPTRVPSGKQTAARFRLHNRSREPWTFKPNPNVGVHLGYWLRTEDESYEVRGGAGYFDAFVAPGESIDLTISLPAIDIPGRYLLKVDLIDGQQCWFWMLGSPPFDTELEVYDESKTAGR